jgi:NAD-reducing hydrogenase large subunit
VQRLCGICPVSHHLAAAKAMDRIVGGEKLTPTAEKMRRLMHYGQMLPVARAALLPPVLARTCCSASTPTRRCATSSASPPKYPTRGAGRDDAQVRAGGHPATAGKKIHGTGAIPGGMNKNLSIAERDELLKDIDQMVEWSRGA